MRIKLEFELENAVIDIQYRKSIISWIKKSIQEYNEELYQQLYANTNPIKKTFCFAPILMHPEFSMDTKTINLSEPSFQIIFSFYDYAYALHLFNAFNFQKNQKHPLCKNSMTLKQIIMLPEKQIHKNSIDIKMISPVICRNHDRKTLKDMYYSFEKAEFYQFININILEQMKNEGLDSSILTDFKIESIQARKTVIAVYEKMIECSIGTFRLTGDTKLLKYLYQAGIGSKKAMGFGLFEII